jgi:hypothetical protein
VRQSGGHIEMDSELGRGTIVSVYLPVAADLAEDTEVPDAASLKDGESRAGIEGD